MAPKTCVWIQQDCQSHDWLAAQRLQHELAETSGALPAFGLAGALKARLHQGGRLSCAAVRLPEVMALLQA
jgi:dihydrodipicolinate synthase/N-acetylneuraminate lyase